MSRSNNSRMSGVLEIANNEGQTPLHVGCAEGHSEVVKLLLDYGANPNAVDAKGATPLHLATIGGHSHIVKQLIDFGCDVNIVDKEGFTASMRAGGSVD